MSQFPRELLLLAGMPCRDGTDPPQTRFPLVLSGGALLDDSPPRLSSMLSDRMKQMLPHAQLMKPEVQMRDRVKYCHT